MKPIVKSLFIAALLLCAMQVAAYDFELDGNAYNFNEDNESVTLSEFVGNRDTLKCFVVPDEVKFNNHVYPVTELGFWLFYSQPGIDLENIYFGRNLRLIPVEALSDVGSVKNITWNAVNCVEYDIVTRSAPKRKLTLGGENRGVGGLNTTQVENITIGNEVESLPDMLLSNAQITSLHIPALLTLNENGSSFWCCEKLETITVDENNTLYDSRNDCNGVVRTADNVLIMAGNATKIPASVTSIACSAFQVVQNIKEIYLPASIKHIDSRAFYFNTQLEKLAVNVADIDNVELGNNVFGAEVLDRWQGVPVNTCVLQVPNGASALYNKADQWKLFRNIEETDFSDVWPPLAADVDGNGTIDLDDVNSVINIILGLNGNYSDADVDFNGIVDIDDVNEIINYILK